MPSFKDKVRIEGVECLRDSPKAILCRIDGEEKWIPQSQVDDDSEVYKAGDEGTLVVSAWLAEQKGLP